MTTQKTAILRVCASCEWIFRNHPQCPKCGFAHYGARYVYGPACYRFEVTQQPWLDKKVARYREELETEIQEANKGRAEREMWECDFRPKINLTQETKQCHTNILYQTTNQKTLRTAAPATKNYTPRL